MRHALRSKPRAAAVSNRPVMRGQTAVRTLARPAARTRAQPRPGHAFSLESLPPMDAGQARAGIESGTNSMGSVTRVASPPRISPRPRRVNGAWFRRPSAYAIVGPRRVRSTASLQCSTRSARDAIPRRIGQRANSRLTTRSVVL
ncbi:hypothetical protein [Lysobacter gummosus]|uniref:hypothetical protein n=1 Tax=Lysobacter gummosus TaxID=262324 RepID=UPI0036285C1E